MSRASLLAASMAALACASLPPPQPRLEDLVRDPVLETYIATRANAQRAKQPEVGRLRGLLRFALAG